MSISIALTDPEPKSLYAVTVSVLLGLKMDLAWTAALLLSRGEVSVVCQNVKLNATYFSSYVETLKIDTLILEDGVLLKQLASITNANIANIDCSSEIYLYQILASGSRVDSQLYSDLKANASSNFDNVRIIRC